MKTRSTLSLVLAIVAGSQNALAVKSDFKVNHSGVSFGGGYYFYPLVHDNIHDPIPSLVQSGATTTGTDKIKLLPLKLGMFKDLRYAGFEIYGRYVMALANKWAVTGAGAGTGSSTFNSYGVGGNFFVVPYMREIFRVKVVVNAEYVRQKIREKFTLADATTEGIDLATTSLLYGVGVEPELWLGDAYSLGIFAGYQYGQSSHWSAAAAGNIGGVNYPAGVLTGNGGGPVASQFGGLLIELNLHLNLN